MEECLQLRRKVFGPDHPRTKDSEQALHQFNTGVWSGLGPVSAIFYDFKKKVTKRWR